MHVSPTMSPHVPNVLPLPCPPPPPQNCTYYWGFAAWMAYYINHPLYTPPGECHRPRSPITSNTRRTHPVTSPRVPLGDTKLAGGWDRCP